MASTTADTWSIDALLNLGWYHGALSRHAAETILMVNGVDGSYLLRESSNYEQTKDLSLSVKCSDSVKHFNIERQGNTYVFGLREFSDPESFAKHFENMPLLGGESGVLTLLKHPYPRLVLESCQYTDVKQVQPSEIPQASVFNVNREHSASFSSSVSSASSSSSNSASKALTKSLQPVFSVTSKEGFLTKRGEIVKSLKQRWFVLDKMSLSYYKDNKVSSPIRSLDLSTATRVQPVHGLEMPFAFELEFPSRTFFLFAGSELERDEWVSVLAWKLSQLKGE